MGGVVEVAVVRALLSVVVLGCGVSLLTLPTPAAADQSRPAEVSARLGGAYDIDFGFTASPTPPATPSSAVTVASAPVSDPGWFSSGGFYWNNFAQAPGIEKISSLNLQDVYGPQACEAAPDSSGQCVLRPTFEAALARMNGQALRGHCAGIAGVYAGLVSGYFSPDGFGSPDGQVATLPLEGNSALQRVINNFIVTEWTLPVAGTDKGRLWDVSPADVPGLLQTYWAEGEVPVMGLASGRLGHAVVPTRLDKVNEVTYWVWVMDPNFPRTQMPVVIDVSDPDHPSWRYVPYPDEVLPGFNYDGSGPLGLLPFSVVAPSQWGSMAPSPGVLATADSTGSDTDAGSGADAGSGTGSGTDTSSGAASPAGTDAVSPGFSWGVLGVLGLGVLGLGGVVLWRRFAPGTPRQ